MAVLVTLAAVYVGLETRTPPAPATIGAPTALTRLHVAPAHEDGTYRRTRFGSSWLDLNHDGCNTREEVMGRDLTAVTKVNGCNVVAGTLADLAQLSA